MFCRNCGKELPENAKFCNQCGQKIGDAEPVTTPAPEPIVIPEPVVIPEPEPKQYTYHAYGRAQNEPQQPNAAPEIPPEYRPLSPWAYFGYSLLFMIPIVGFILLIVFSFVGGNINRRNFARSYWCGLILALAILLILIVLVFVGVLRGPFEAVVFWIRSGGPAALFH